MVELSIRELNRWKKLTPYRDNGIESKTHYELRVACGNEYKNFNFTAIISNHSNRPLFALTNIFSLAFGSEEIKRLKEIDEVCLDECLMKNVMKCIYQSNACTRQT